MSGWRSANHSVIRRLDGAYELDQQFQERPGDFSDAELLARAAPAWLGAEMDYTAAFARALQTKPLLWLRARPGQASSLAAHLDGAQADEARWQDALLYDGDSDLFRDADFQAGNFEIQDFLGGECTQLTRDHACIFNPQPEDNKRSDIANHGLPHSLAELAYVLIGPRKNQLLFSRLR